MQTTWEGNSAREIALKTIFSSVTEATSTYPGDVEASDDVVRRLATDVESADVSISTPITAIMVVSAFVFLTVFSVIAYVMRVRYRHHVSSWQHVGEEGIQLQPFIRHA